MAAWNAVTSVNDNQGRLDYVSVQNDDGSFYFTDYDQANGAAWNAVTWLTTTMAGSTTSRFRTTTPRSTSRITTRRTVRHGTPSPG